MNIKKIEWKTYIHEYFWKYKFNMEFINEIWKMGLKINIDLFLKNGKFISCKDIFGK